MLLAAGHTLADLFDRRQEGLPYAGWTLPQFGFWCERAVRALGAAKADVIEATRLAIAACFDEKAGKEVTAAVKRLRGALG